MAEPVIDIQNDRTSLELVEVNTLKEVSDPVVTAAHALGVTDQPSLDFAGAFLTEKIKPMLKQIAESCGPVVKAAHAAHKAAKGQQNELETPLKEAESVVKGKIQGYLTEQERIAREEARRVAEEQQRQAEEEQLARAAKLEAEGRADEADAVLEGPPPEPAMPAPPPAPPPQKVAGISTRKVWKAECTDLPALIADIAAGRAPINLVKLDQGVLNRQVQSLDGAVQYAGVSVYQDHAVSARAR